MYSLTNRSPYRIQCNSSSNRSPYRIQCNSIVLTGLPIGYSIIVALTGLPIWDTVENIALSFLYRMVCYIYNGYKICCHIQIHTLLYIDM